MNPPPQFRKPGYKLSLAGLLILFPLSVLSAAAPGNAESTAWKIDSNDQWREAAQTSTHLRFEGGFARPTAPTATYRSHLRRFSRPRSLTSLTLTQSPDWLNWKAVGKVGPKNLRDAPVFLALGPQNYWIFGRYQGNEGKAFLAKDAALAGFDIPLKTTPFANQYDAPGGRKESLGGYHAWQSRDMVNWVHHGPVTDQRAGWVTTAEFVDGKAYIYYDFPNDRNPHLIIDADLSDGVPGVDQGMVFAAPSAGSDCTVIRDRTGRFHLVYEDWSPIDASKHSWDSPLAGHAVSSDGRGNFKILAPVVDVRTKPTGLFKEYPHPHWHRDDPAKYPGKPDKDGVMRAFGRYEVHEPEQDAFGDWAAIAIGGQYYLFGDFHPAGTTRREEMKIAWFTAGNIDVPFKQIGAMGSGHPDPDIGFAEGQFYLINQTSQDYVSPGPWVETVRVRVGIDTTGKGVPDRWSDWQTVKESYDYAEGFAKQISRKPASMMVDGIPKGFGFCYELKIEDSSENDSSPVLDSIEIHFD